MDTNDKIQQMLAESRKSLSPDQARALLDRAEEILSRIGMDPIVGIEGPELLIPGAVPPEVPNSDYSDSSDSPTRTTRTTENK